MPSAPNSYENLIRNFLVQEFTGVVAGQCAVFEAVVAEMLGTKQRRYGPMPVPEQLVVVRDIVRTAMKDQKPIEILIPWGSSKQGDGGLDVLELGALKQLECLQHSIQRHYQPGIQVTMRVEDATDKMLFSDFFHPKIEQYRDNLAALVVGLGYDAFIDVRPETEMLNFDHFQEHVYQLAEVITRFLKRRDKGILNDADWTALRATGWHGDMPSEQIDYYLRSYKTFYPAEDSAFYFDLMATYFSCSLERRNLKATGAPQNPHLQIAFNLPVPGIPWEMAKNRIYYRTLPEKWTNQHKAPWIGKGYIQIANDNSCKLKLANFNDPLEVTPFEFEIGDAIVQAPYILV